MGSGYSAPGCGGSHGIASPQGRQTLGSSSLNDHFEPHVDEAGLFCNPGDRLGLEDQVLIKIQCSSHTDEYAYSICMEQGQEDRIPVESWRAWKKWRDMEKRQADADLPRPSLLSDPSTILRRIRQGHHFHSYNHVCPGSTLAGGSVGVGVGTS